MILAYSKTPRRPVVPSCHQFGQLLALCSISCVMSLCAGMLIAQSRNKDALNGIFIHVGKVLLHL